MTCRRTFPEPRLLWGAARAGALAMSRAAAAGRARRGRALPALALLAALAAAALLALGPAAQAEPGSATVSYGGSDYTVAYDATGMSVGSMSIDDAFVALIMSVQVGGPGNGVLEVTLDRAFLDARGEFGDDEFVVIYDGGEEAAVEEPDGGAAGMPASRTIRFELPPGSDEVIIVGTVLGGGQDPGSDAPQGGGQDPGSDAPQGGGQDPGSDAPQGGGQDPGSDAPPGGDPAGGGATPRQDDPQPQPALASFVDGSTDPVEYVKRYATEPEFATWFDANFAGEYGSICAAVGLDDGCVESYTAAAASAAAASAAAQLREQQQQQLEQQQQQQQQPPPPQAQPAPAEAADGPAGFVDPSVDPYTEYVQRYISEDAYRAWFDAEYPGREFCDAVGLEAGCVEVYRERVAAAAEEAAAAAAAAAEEEAAAAAAEEEAAAAAAAAEGVALANACGEGTILRDGVCVPKPEPRKPVGSGRELATGVIAAFVIALAATVIFWLISRAGRKKHTPSLGGARDGAGGGGGGARDGAGGGGGGGSSGSDDAGSGAGDPARGSASIV